MGWVHEKVAEGIGSLRAELVGPGAPWKAKSVWLAVVLVVLGSGFWRSETFHGGGPASSAAVHLGMSYIGGFFLGWCYRRFVTLSVALTGGVLAVLMTVRSLGWFESDAATLQDQVHAGTAWLREHAEALNRHLTGLFPSAGAAGVGIFRGFRRKRVTAAVSDDVRKPD